MEINFLNKVKLKKININNNIISINIYKLSHYDVNSCLGDIAGLLDDSIKINFSEEISEMERNAILCKFSNFFFNYLHPRNIILNPQFYSLMNSIDEYKKILIKPNKTPQIMLKYFMKKIPMNYTYKKFSIRRYGDKLFPLTSGVGQGSSYPSYFLHIFPKKINPNWDNICLIGKCVTFDSGGMNLKISEMEKMKYDVAGSSIIMEVFQLVKDLNKNFHLLFPIVENYIDADAIKPSAVIKSLNGKTVEITNTDAEGRLCIADAIEYFHKFIYNKSLKNPFILDIGTYTTNKFSISCDVSSVATCNSQGKKYMEQLQKAGEKCWEYVDYLILWENYVESLKSKVADIKNFNNKCPAGCMVNASFINYFVNDVCPWIHIDIGGLPLQNDIPKSYGILLLKTFLESL